MLITIITNNYKLFKNGTFIWITFKIYLKQKFADKYGTKINLQLDYLSQKYNCEIIKIWKLNKFGY